MSTARIVVAIDGLAASGKSTLARLLAERLGYIHLSTGMIYRTVALLCVRHEVDPMDPQAVVGLLDNHHIELRGSKHAAELLLDGSDISSQLYSPEISEATSKCAQHAMVRTALHSIQRDAFPGENLVAEGRDMGTVVFKDAQVKFFIEVSPDVRVERRIKQLMAKSDKPADQEALKAEMIREITERDARDAGRSVAPTVAAPGSILIENSNKTIDQVLQEMEAAVRRSIT